MDVTTGIAAVKNGFDLFEKLHGLYKRCVQRMPAGAEKTEGENALREADEALKLARAKVAEGFGFVLCRRHFPPGVMVKLHGAGYTQWRCESCGAKDPSDEELREEESYDPFAR